MAVLGATSLTNCNSIPSFIGSGSKMIFRMATVPVSWTKDTTPNEAMCRITNSTVSPGGSIAFTSVFQSNKTISGTTSSNAIPITVNPQPNSVTFQPASVSETFGSFTVFGATVTNVQMAPHNHFYTGRGSSVSPRAIGTLNYGLAFTTAAVTDAAGQAGPHTHTANYSPHNHTAGSGTHTHTVQQVQHSHPVSGSDNFALAYIDIVIATKD